MSVDKSLLSKVSMARSRSVYTREERLAILKREGRVGDSTVFGLPKTRVEKAMKKVKAVKEKVADGAAAPAAAGAKPAAAGAKAPAAAAGAKAPAAKAPAAAAKAPAKK